MMIVKIKKTESKWKKKNNSKKSNNDESISSQTDGFALLAGFGTPYAGLGIQGAYYYHADPLWTITPYVAGGYFDSSPSFAFGSMFTYGMRHRAFLDFSYFHYTSTLEEGSINSSGDWEEEEVKVGSVLISGSAGYEFCANNGFVFRISAGFCYKANGDHISNDPIPSIAVGYKF